MKKLLIEFFVLLFISTCLFSNLEIINAFATPTFEAEGVVLMDAKSGQILFSKNPHVQYEPASITKVMTALVVLENSNLYDEVVIGKNPPLVDGSALGIVEGEIYNVEELLLALLLSSSNDCAEALAEHISGSNSEFGKLMTEKAIELGAYNTTFKNPSGLPEDGHLTTAYDMALIMRHASSNEDFVRISQTDSYHFINHPFSDNSEKWATNGNHCLLDWSAYYYEYLYTGKTGWTSAANHTYISTAIKDDTLLVGTLLNSLNKDTHYRDVSKLYEWGFENFTTDLIVEAGEIIGEFNIDDKTTIPLVANNNIYYSFSTNESDMLNIELEYIEKDLSETNISEGDFLFDATLLVNGSTHTTVELLSGIDREFIPTVAVINNTTSNILKFIFNIVLFILTFLILLIIIVRTIRNIRRRRRYKNKFPTYIFHKKR